MTEILMQKIEDGLHPVDQDGYEAIRHFNDGVFVKVKFSVPRNIRQFRLYHAMINLIFVHQREPKVFPTREIMRKEISIALGHCQEVRNSFTGKTYTIVRSTDFGSMDQLEWIEYFDAFKRFVLEKIVPGVGSKDLDQAIADMLRITGPEQMER